MQNFLTNKEISYEIDNFCETYENENYYGPDVIEVCRHMAKWAEDKVSEYYEDRLDAAACEYTAKGYATGKKHLIEDLKEELNEIINWLSNGDEHSEILKLESIINGYKAILMWLDNESNGISKKDN